MVREPWISHILTGKKTWEIRGTNTHVRGQIFLAASGTGTLLGTAELVDVVGPLNEGEFRRSANLHLTSEQEMNEGMPYRNTFAWVFKNPVRFVRPVRYRHPSGAITWVKLKDFKPGVEEFEVQNTPARERFVRSLAGDIELLGHSIAVVILDATLRLTVKYSDEKLDDADHIRKVYRTIALRRMQMTPAPCSLSVAPHPDSIRPELTLCQSAEDLAVFNAIRQNAQLPTSTGLGRYLQGILWDAGQNPRRPMGILGLTGAGYAVQCRDEFLLWNVGRSSLSAQKREEGLKRILHLSVCLAAPPYNQLRVGKLLSLLAFSAPVVTEFRRRWSEPLLGITTTSAFGLQGGIYRRLHPNRMQPQIKYQSFSNLLFRRIGETSGEYFPVVSDQTRRLSQ